MKCPKCQAENREDAEFCGDCGIKLEIVCSKCGRSNPTSKSFCDKCGEALGAPKPAPPIDYSEPQSYIPKFIADKILDTRSSIEGERKLVTVLFADVANYTSMTEKLDPEEVHQIMDGCFKVLMDEIHRYEGTIDKFTGDGVMALFGAPIAHEDHAQRACYAALAIQKAMGEYGDKIGKDYGVEFKMRVGIDSGHVIVGSVGNDLKMDYTAIGDPVNLASRMEGLAEPSTVYVTNDTFKLTEGFFNFKSLGKVNVKGKDEAVEAYRLGGTGEIETRFGAAIAKGLSRFVGRQKEIAALLEAFDKAKAGSGQVVGVVGEAGVGKSRLLLELRESLSQEQYTYLEGRCLHYGSTMPYLPILDNLRAYFDIKDIEQESAIKKKMKKALKQLDVNADTVLPPLHDLLSLKIEDEEYLNLEPQQKRERTFEAIKSLLIALSQSEPLILAVEDLHWIDKTSEEFLDYLIGSLANARIQLILLYRPEYAHSWGSRSSYSQVRVDELTADPSIELVRSILEVADVASDLSELILSRASGNPLFIEELTHNLVENGFIHRNNGQYVLSAKVSDIHVPETIQGIIAARMDRLEDNLKRTMQVASVIGRDFAYRILGTITGMQDELKSHLLSLQGLEFIYEKSLFPELEYIFKHALTQEVAYNSLLFKRRKDIHEKIGKAVEELYADRLEEFYEVLSHHYSRSENHEKAYQYLKLSGDKASRSYSNWEVIRFYRGAINVLNTLPETEENKRRGVEVHLLMGTPMALQGYPEDDSLQILQEGERLSRELDDYRSLAYFYSEIGFYYSVKGQPDLGIQYCESSFYEAEKVKDIDLMAPTGFDLCLSYHSKGDCSKMIDVTSKVLALLEETQRQSESFGRPNPYLGLHLWYANALDMLGDFREGQKVREKALRLALEIKDINALSMAELIHGMSLLIHKGDGESGVKHLQTCIRHCEEAQTLVISSMAWGGLGWGYYLLGDLDTAREYAEKGLKMQSDAGVTVLLSLPYCALCMVHFDSGDLERAQSCAEEALRLSENNNEKWVEGISRTLLGRALGKREKSQYAKAEEYILQGIKALDALKIRPNCSIGYLYLGELYTNTDQREKALETLKKAESEFQEMSMDYYLRRTQELLERVEG
jgi:class 3 adenylate cyclase